jgi:hypothetical protein
MRSGIPAGMVTIARGRHGNVVALARPTKLFCCSGLRDTALQQEPMRPPIAFPLCIYSTSNAYSTPLL